MINISRANVNRFFLFLVIVWSPFHFTIFPFDGKGRFLLSLTFFVFFLCLDDWFKTMKIVFRSPAIFYFLWLVYVLICSFYKGIKFEDVTFFDQVCILFSPFVTLIVTAREYMRNGKRVLKLFNFSFFMYAVLGIYMLLGSAVSESSGRLINVHLGNQLPLNMVLLIFITCLRYIRKEVGVELVVIYCSIALLVIVVSATRKAFASSLIIFSFTLFAVFKQGDEWKRFEIILLCIFLAIVCNVVISGSVLGQRIDTTAQVGADYNTSSYPILNYLGDRSYQYLLGFLLFLESPLTGVGLLNYMNQALDSIRLHSEYMVQLCECGLIGCVFTLSFYVSMLKRVSRNRKKIGPGVVLVLRSGVFSVLFINMSAWSYDNPIYFVIFGIMVGSYLKSKKSIG